MWICNDYISDICENKYENMYVRINLTDTCVWLSIWLHMQTKWLVVGVQRPGNI